MEDLQVSIGQALLPVVEAILPLVKDFAQWAADNPQTFTYVAGAIGLVAAAIIATNIAMALNPFRTNRRRDRATHRRNCYGIQQVRVV
jgi:hypothetical protein